jgi:hypothetical protein
MDDFRYQTLLNCLLDGRCVLVLGPELFRYDGKLLGDALSEHLKIDSNPYISFYDPKDELFYFKGKNLAASKNAVYRQIRDYYAGLVVSELHEKIAQLPFSLFVNLSPDLQLANAFEKKKMAHEFRFYNKKLNRDPNNIQFEPDEEEGFEASPTHPLVYNLCGHIGYEESLILTYSDLFDFLFNVFGRNNLPLSLRNILEIQDNGQEKDYLFLGFLRLLNAQAGNQRFVLGEDLEQLEAAASDTAREDKSIFYLQDYFTLDLMDCAPDEVLERLFKDCAQAGKLRKADTASENTTLPSMNQPLSMTLQEWMMRNKIRKVFDALRSFFNQNPNSEAMEMVIVNAAKYEDLLQQENKGTLYRSELSVEKSRVLNGLNQLIELVKKVEQNKASA